MQQLRSNFSDTSITKLHHFSVLLLLQMRLLQLRGSNYNATSLTKLHQLRFMQLMRLL